jgi:hypothetical protein
MRALWMLTVAGLLAAAPPARGGEPAGDPAAKLAAMPANSWLCLGYGWRGGHEVPACFDQANRLFFKYGGCGDGTPTVKISFPKGDPRYPNGYSNTCWVLNLAAGQWELRGEYDCSWPADRPGNGCSRGYCYDSKRKLVWLYGGISDGGGGGSTWEMWSYDGKERKFADSKSRGKPPGGDSNGGDNFCYDPIHDWILMPKAKAVWVFKPAESAWECRQTPGGPGGFGHYAPVTFDAEARRMVYLVAAATGKTAAEAPPPAQADCWKLSKKDKTWSEMVLDAWTYDPEANKWDKLAPKPDAPRPCWRYRQGLTYDSKNKATILVGGSTNTWEADEKYYNDVWILETAKAAWTRMDPAKPWPTGHNAWRDNRSCAYDEPDNVVLWMPNDGQVWAYRYK